MRIYEDADFRLVVTDSSLGLAGVLFAAGAALLGVASLHPDAHARTGLSVSGCFLLLCALLLLRTTRFVFDRAQRMLTWQRRRILSRSSGQIPFDDIRGVVVEATGLAGGTDGVSYRLALTTASEVIPFSDAYGSNRALYESMRNRMLAFLGLGSAPPSRAAAAEDDLHELVRRRRIVDALALLRARENVGLMEARRRIAEIEKQIAAD